MKDQHMLNHRCCALALAGFGALGSALGPASALTIQEPFATDPALQGWIMTGDPSLFHWNATNQNLEVTWDSSKPNSFFCHPLERSLERLDAFVLEFDLFLSHFASGVDPQKPNPFQLSVGLINLAQASAPEFHRGSGYESPNLVEFSFFPDPGGAWTFGPSLTAVLIDWTGTNWSYDYVRAGLASTHWLHVTMTYSNQTLRTSVTEDGTLIATVGGARAGGEFRDFQVDHVAIASYSDVGQDPFFEGSILAQGRIDNIAVRVEPPGIGELAGTLTNGVWQGWVHARTNWPYTLERSTNFVDWASVSPTVTGTGASLKLEDASPPANRAVYRARSKQP